MSLSYPKQDWRAGYDPKKDWRAGYDTDFKILYNMKCSVVCVIPKEGLAGPQPANPSLSMTTTKTLRSVFS